ncbi:MAG: tetraacyldisaccharide 4'-kinase [Halioglobus sp.]|nr:tetraacyldisaccharide 4'-kinase [Halioglobus sp.]
MIPPWYRALEEAWYRGAWWLGLLIPAEWLFRSVTFLRRAAYRRGLLHVYRSPGPVVVVGNITPGGTGKTPVVIALAQALSDRGIRVGVVSRGHGARAGGGPHLVDASSTVEDCGDEALLIFRRAGCPCAVGRSRPAALRLLEAETDVDLVISDDGLQHYAMARDLEIVLYDRRWGFGNGRCLPAGPLREPLSRLGEVDFVLCRGRDEDADVHYRAGGLVNIASGERREFSPAAIGTAIHAVAAIGCPRQFLDELAGAGFEPEAHVFRDHYVFRREDFAALLDKPIIMTEKDAVKCANLAGENAWFVQISAVVPRQLTAAVLSLVKS